MPRTSLSMLFLASLVAVVLAAAFAYWRTRSAEFLMLVVVAFWGRGIASAVTSGTLFLGKDRETGFHGPAAALLPDRISQGDVLAFEVALFYAMLATTVVIAARAWSRRPA